MFTRKTAWVVILSLVCLISPVSAHALKSTASTSIIGAIGAAEATQAQKIEDPAALINHAPAIKSVGLKRDSDGGFYLDIFVDKAHEEIRRLNEISDNGVSIEIWLRTGNKGWVKCHKGGLVEEAVISADAETYLGEIDSEAPVSYDIASIYSFDYASYPAAEKSGLLQSPLSGIVAKTTALYSKASDWAIPELESAEKYRLLPASLRGEDMTRPITREEFAELSICIYEKAADLKASAAPDTFEDTANPEVLKAKDLGITQGTSATTFSPEESINREQVAAMLGRTAVLIAPDADFSTDGAPAFSDRDQISSWAMEHVAFMAKIGVIEGADGKFMPRATTSSQIKSGYATTTREQAISMGVRLLEWKNGLPKENIDLPAANE